MACNTIGGYQLLLAEQAYALTEAGTCGAAQLGQCSVGDLGTPQK